MATTKIPESKEWIDGQFKYEFAAVDAAIHADHDVTLFSPTIIDTNHSKTEAYCKTCNTIFDYSTLETTKVNEY